MANVTVYAGIIDRSNLGSAHFKDTVNKSGMFIHDGYSMDKFDNDIGLVKTSKMNLNQIMGTIWIPPAERDLFQKGTIAGFGRDKDTKEPDQNLKFSGPESSDASHCSQVYGRTLTHGLKCLNSMKTKASCIMLVLILN
jgi:hypothetical protein